MQDKWITMWVEDDATRHLEGSERTGTAWERLLGEPMPAKPERVENPGDCIIRYYANGWRTLTGPDGTEIQRPATPWGERKLYRGPDPAHYAEIEAVAAALGPHIARESGVGALLRPDIITRIASATLRLAGERYGVGPAPSAQRLVDAIMRNQPPSRDPREF